MGKHGERLIYDIAGEESINDTLGRNLIGTNHSARHCIPSPGRFMFGYASSVSFLCVAGVQCREKGWDES